MGNERYKELASHEIGWWKAHHRKDKSKLIDEMSKLYQLQFSITYEQAREAVLKRVDATKEHDIAERLEDGGNQREADVHWENAECLLLEHFKILDKHIL
jgi:hypothetical protein